MRDIIESLAVIPNSSEFFSEPWVIVNRANGRMVERMAKRLTAIECGGELRALTSEQVHTDSTLSFDSDPLDIGTMTTSTGVVEVTTDEPHGFSAGNLVSLQCTGIDGQYEITTTGYSTVTNYWPVCGYCNESSVDSSLYRVDVNGASQPAANFSITNMYVRLRTAPGAGKYRRFTLYKNSEATGLSVTIGGTDTTGNMTNSVSFSGSLTDTMTIVEDLINGAADSAFSIGMTMQTSVDKQIFIGSEEFDTSGFDYNTILHGIPLSDVVQNPFGFCLWGAATASFPIRGYSSLFTSGGTLKNFEMKISTADQYSGGGDAFDGIGFYPDAADTAEYVRFYMDVYNSNLTTDTSDELLRFTGPETGRKISSFEVDIDQGQWATILGSYSQQAMNIQEPRNVLEFYPDNAGHRVFGCKHSPQSGSVPTYNPGTCSTFSGLEDSTEYAFSIIPCSGTIKNLMVSCLPSTTDAVANNDNPHVFTFRKNGVDTSLTCTIPDSQSTAEDLTNSFVVEAGDRISISCVAPIDDIGSSGIAVGWTFVADNPLETPMFLVSFGDDTTSPNTPVTDTRKFIIPADNTGVYTGGGFVRLTEDTFTGLDHLNGEYVSILADGVSLPGSFVVDGSVVASSAAGQVSIGLPYLSDLELLPIQITEDRDTTLARKIKCGNVSWEMVDSHGGLVGEDFDHLYDAFTDTIIEQNSSELSFNEDLTTLNTSSVLLSGVIRRPLNGKWKHGPTICLRQNQPLPIHITSVAPEINVGGSV